MHRTADGAEETREACEAFGVETRVVQADVAVDDDCRRLAQTAVDAWGRIDALVNNAGTTVFCPLHDLEGLSADEFQRLYGVNTVGAFQMSRAAGPIMQSGGRGSIVMVASIAGMLGVGSSIAYAASKGAMITLTRSLARVLGPEVRVNAVCPGFIQGDWLRDGLGAEAYEAGKSYLEATTPLGRTATADTVAEAIVFFIEGADFGDGRDADSRRRLAFDRHADRTARVVRWEIKLESSFTRLLLWKDAERDGKCC